MSLANKPLSIFLSLADPWHACCKELFCRSYRITESNKLIAIELPLRYEKLKSSIKVIKRNQNVNSNSAQKGGTKKAGARNKREIAMTVKNWIVELRQERQTRSHFFAKLPD